MEQQYRLTWVAYSVVGWILDKPIPTQYAAFFNSPCTPDSAITPGAVVALFYALESFLEFRASGIAAPLFVKVLICAIGIYVFFRNIRLVKKRKTEGSSSNAG
jgi:hypothetical protein